MSPITFRNSKIVYYGPFDCPQCGLPIAKMGNEWGGTSFTYPDGPVYPNTEWHPHVCDPSLVRKQLGNAAERRISADWPHAHPVKIAQLGFVILAEPDCPEKTSKAYLEPLAISENQTYHDTPESAWEGALERQQKNWPTWHVTTPRDGTATFGNDLDSLPQCEPAV